MKQILITIATLLVYTGAIAQSAITGSSKYGTDNTGSAALFQNTSNTPDFKLHMGTSFGSFGGSSSLLSSYIAPSLNFDASPRLNITAGALVMNNNFNNFQQSPLMMPGMTMNQNMTDSYLYVQGDYRLSEKVTISGGAFRKVNTSVYQQEMNPMARNYDYSAYNVGMRYKVNDNAQIEAQFNFIRGNPYNQPFNSFHSPFQSRFSPFGNFGDPHNPFD